MERITLPNTPTDLSPMDACLDYKYDDNQYARVIIEMRQGDNDMFILKSQAFAMTAEGNFVVAPKGYPSRTNSVDSTIARSSIGDTASLVPGWIRMAPPNKVVYAPESPDLPEGTLVLDALPATGAVGDRVMVGDNLYGWTPGVVRQLAEGRIGDLRNLLRVSTPLSNLGFDHGAL